MRILAIDPGNEKSAFMLYEQEPMVFGKQDNDRLAARLVENELPADVLAIETLFVRGMPTAQQELDTQLWAGRLIQAWGGESFRQIRRLDVKVAICGSARAKDGNIRQALIDRYGGEDRAIGGKKCAACKGKMWIGRGHSPCTRCAATGFEYPPGPLHKITADIWSALAIAICADQQLKESTNV